jgi:hypothetical protein
MEDLVIRDREHEYARLLSFMGLDDNDATRDFFERRQPEAAHAGRWREEVPPERRRVRGALRAWWMTCDSADAPTPREPPAPGDSA